jgi:L-asparaginase/Glu-tRNA(Gln) amidotransferase subunit D
MSNTEAVSLEGTWNVVLKGPRGKQPSVLVLERAGDTITGTQSGSTGGTTPVSEVQVDGTKVSWVNQVTKPMNLKVVFTAEIDGNSMSGKAKIGFMGSYPFTAVKE